MSKAAAIRIDPKLRSRTTGKWLTGSLAKAATSEDYDLIMTTVPTKKPGVDFAANPLTLADFGYQYVKDEALTNNRTCLRTLKDPSKGFQWLGQKHYDAVGKAMVEDIYGMLSGPDYKLRRVQLPLTAAEEKAFAAEAKPTSATSAAETASSPASTTATTDEVASSSAASSPASAPPTDNKPTGTKTQRSEPTIPIFVSQDAMTADTIMLIMQGTGAVRPGMWARALCMNESLEMGTVFGYIKKAQERGWGVIVTNPNENTVPAQDPLVASDDGQCTVDEFWLGTTDEAWKPFARKCETTAERVRGSETPMGHSQYVYNKFVMPSKAKKVVIVAHSFGGICVGSLVRDPSIFKHMAKKCVAVAFTDACNDCSAKDPAPVVDFYRKKQINWVASKRPLDAKVGLHRCGSEERSAGHEAHEWTSACCTEPLFAWVDSMHAAAN